jgi:hypothetical protein
MEIGNKKTEHIRLKVFPQCVITETTAFNFAYTNKEADESTSNKVSVWLSEY